MIYDDYDMPSALEIRVLAQHAAERRQKVVPAIRFSNVRQAISFNPDAPIDISFLDGFDDHYVSLLIDVAVNPQTDGFNPFDDVVMAGNPTGPGKNVPFKHARIMEAFIKTHGVDAVYLALEAAGRISFRDKRFSADLGL